MNQMVTFLACVLETVDLVRYKSTFSFLSNNDNHNQEVIVRAWFVDRSAQSDKINKLVMSDPRTTLVRPYSIQKLINDNRHESLEIAA